MADTLLGGIVISEVLVDPNGTANNFDTDGNGTANATDEFVELRNDSTAAIDISGVQLWDEGTGNWFTFPAGTVLEPGAHAVVVTGLQTGGTLPTGGPDDLAFDAGRGTAVLNNGGDNVVVYDPGSDTFIQARYNGDALDDPVANYARFSTTATRSGAGENIGTDIDGFSIQRTPDGTDVFINDETPTPADRNICFTPGALIRTAEGERPVESLRVGDLVVTRDHGLQPIRWIGLRTYGEDAVRAHPHIRPIRIGSGALGAGLPRRDLVVSPQHRVMVRGRIAVRMFETEEVLAAAKHLTAVAGVDICGDIEPVTYIHIMFDQHQVIYAEGAPVESFYAGAHALRSIDLAAFAELVAMFPHLRDRREDERPRAARRLLKGREARQLARRHAKNAKPLFVETV